MRERGCQQRLESKVFSVFIGNVPTRANWRSLWSFLEKRVRVIDVYLSKKKDISVPRFAFVRFNSFEEASKCVRIFQSMLYLGSKLNVVHAVDGERRQYWKRIQHQGDCKDSSGVSCGEVRVKSSPVLRVPAVEDPSLVQALNRSVVGVLPENISFCEIQTELCTKRNLDVVVRVLSDNEVLVEFKSWVSFAEERRENFPSFGSVFSEFRVWDASIMDEREAWLCISGLPWRFWSSQSFENIAKIWGAFNGVHECTENGVDLRNGYIKIKTVKREKIEEVIEVFCDASLFKVKVCETEVACNFYVLESDNPPILRPAAAADDSSAEQGSLLYGAESDCGVHSYSSPGSVQSLMEASVPQKDGDVPRSVERPVIERDDLDSAVEDINDGSGFVQELGQCDLNLNLGHVVGPPDVGVCDCVCMDVGSEDAVAQQVEKGEASCVMGAVLVGLENTGPPVQDHQGITDDDPFDLMEIINKLNGGKVKTKKNRDKGSVISTGDHLGWEPCGHVAMVEFGPSDINLDGVYESVDSGHSSTRPWSKLFGDCTSANRVGAKSNYTRVKKGAYGSLPTIK